MGGSPILPSPHGEVATAVALLYLPLMGKGDRYPLWVVVDEVLRCGRCYFLLVPYLQKAPHPPIFSFVENRSPLPLKGKDLFESIRVGVDLRPSSPKAMFFKMRSSSAPLKRVVGI